ncbi:MAG TPA: integrin alpha [Candidatus Binatia bacterium]
MKVANSSSSLLVAATVAAALAMPHSAFAQAFNINCTKGGDEMGHAIATNGDFNGDGVPDIAIGSPCFFSGTSPRAGRVIVIDGRNGKRLFKKKGKQIGQWFGAGLSFIPDLNGDGKDELAIGSPGYDVTGVDRGDPFAGTYESGGKVEVFSKHRRRMRVFGQSANSGFGEKIAPTSDIDGDGRPDFLVSASTDTNPTGRSNPGRVWLVSGRNGDLLNYRVGPKAGKNYGRALCAADDVDGDGLRDFYAGSDEINIPFVFNAGALDLVSTGDFQGDPLLEVTGARGDHLARTCDFAGDVEKSGVKDFIVGAFGADDNGITKAGLVTLFDNHGTRLWVRQDGVVQDKAEFGDAVATIGDINGDGITDFAASAPLFDVFLDKRVELDAGRITTLSGVNGAPIWALNGTHRDNNFGTALAGGLDFDLDEVPDVIVGTPGDDPFGRRGAGSVRILSGVDGHELFVAGGRRGLETRIVTAMPGTGNAAQLRSFNRHGHGQILNTPALEGVKLGELDVTVLNDRNIPKPKIVQAAISSGHGSNSSTVEVYRMGNKSLQVDKFEAFPGANFGVECDGGEVNGQPLEEIVCAQADSVDGNVLVRVLQRLDEQQPFFPILEFTAFTNADMATPVLPVNADGGNVAVGDVTGNNDEEIIVGTNRGAPLVKIFSKTGQFIRSFLAYDPVSSSGVDVAVVAQAGGTKRIVTAPRQGEALIKLFDGNGARVVAGRDNIPVSINVRPAPYNGGARVGAADVDLDDAQEMLVLIPSPAGQQEVSAWEVTNKPVRHFIPFNPGPGATKEGGGIAGTDRFVRN